MTLTEEARERVTVIAVDGRLDAESARRFGERLTALIGSGRSRLLIEASNLDYLGSIGLRQLLLVARHAEDARGCMAVCNLTASVRHVLELSGFNNLLLTYPSREEAHAAAMKLCENECPSGSPESP